MSGHFKPGSVVWLPNRKSIAVVDKGGRLVYGSGEFHHALPGSITADGARPLVVIDPEDDEQVERLALLHLACYGVREGTKPEPIEKMHMRDALREFATPTPRIAEPQGLYAVVEDDAGIEWIHVRQAPGAACWRPLDDGRGGAYTMWADVNAVCVLSEGVPS